VRVNESVRVPMEFVKDGEIVLNISFEATSALSLGNEFIEFKGRFGGVARDILVPVDRVLAIYARENGQGMAFPMPVAGGDMVESKAADALEPSTAGASKSKAGSGTRPSLTRIK
jgi:stringent starvation protein B